MLGGEVGRSASAPRAEDRQYGEHDRGKAAGALVPNRTAAAPRAATNGWGRRTAGIPGPWGSSGTGAPSGAA